VPININKVDIVQGHVWDSVTFEPNKVVRSVQMFRVPIGLVDPTTGKTKTAADTSMTMVSQFPAPQHFRIHRYIFTFSQSTTEEDMYSLAESFVWEFWAGCKKYHTSPIISLQTVDLGKAPIRICQYCTSVYVQAMQCPGCGSRDFALTDLGGESIGRSRGFVMDLGPEPERGMHILQGQQFHVELHGDGYECRQRAKLWCHFEGLLARGVQ
jgi:hypothetical protein